MCGGHHFINQGSAFWKSHVSNTAFFSVSSHRFFSLAALVEKTPNLEKIPFAWNIMHSGDYEKAVQAKGNMKKFDFIHMIQVSGHFTFHQLHVALDQPPGCSWCLDYLCVCVCAYRNSFGSLCSSIFLRVLPNALPNR